MSRIVRRRAERAGPAVIFPFCWPGRLAWHPVVQRSPVALSRSTRDWIAEGGRSLDSDDAMRIVFRATRR
jgi:hypothetical protein